MSLHRDELKPLFKAYALGYASSALPRLPGTINKAANPSLSFQQRLILLEKLLLSPIGFNRFPTACAIIIGGSTLLSRRLEKLLNLWLKRTRSGKFGQFRHLLRAMMLPFSSFWCAWLAFSLLNRDDSWSRKRAASSVKRSQTPDTHQLLPKDYNFGYAGKTMDLTLFAVCRAVDAVVASVWFGTRNSRLHPDILVPRVSHILRKTADPALFAASSALIMWSWFFSPERLPKTYNHWIGQIAQIDVRLVNALRLCRQGDFVYGWPDTEDADLPSLCKELDMPERWGNPAITIPIPCELYHCGAGRSCETHACKRFGRTFTSAMRLYLPLQLLGLIRRSESPSARLPLILRNAVRSSAFLAAFVSLFYYFVCLTRTRLGPRMCPSFSPQKWDSGLCVLGGCVACGWSIMLEKANRRQEIAQFVAPRALATILPRVYDKKYQRREQIVFACSIAVLLSAVQHRTHHVRGVFGSVLGDLMS